MPSGRPAVVIALHPKERAELEALLRRRRIAKADAQRAQVILLAAEGASTRAIEVRTGLSTPTIVKWRQRFLAHRTAGLSELPRSGAPRQVSDEQIESIIAQTLESTPAGATHWSTREMAKSCGFSRQTGQPHLAHLWAPTAPERELHPFHRSVLRRQGARRGRPLP